MTQAISAFVNPIHQTALRNGTSLRQQPLTLLQPKSIIYYAPRSRVSLIMAVDDDSTKDEHVGEEPPKFTQKFDPESETDAFGRDPRKETDFWREAAKSVLASEEVKNAIAEHQQIAGDGLTDEQRAYIDFLKRLDTDKEESDDK